MRPAATSRVTETSPSQLKIIIHASPTPNPISLFIRSVVRAFIELFIRQSIKAMQSVIL